MTALPKFPKPKQVEGKVELSPAQLRKERKRRWEAGDRKCHLCSRLILDFEDYCLDHIEPAFGVGSKRDSQASNLAPAHWRCNLYNLAPAHWRCNLYNLAPAHWRCNLYKGSRRDLESVRRELRERYA